MGKQAVVAVIGFAAMAAGTLYLTGFPPDRVSGSEGTIGAAVRYEEPTERTAAVSMYVRSDRFRSLMLHDAVRLAFGDAALVQALADRDVARVLADVRVQRLIIAGKALDALEAPSARQLHAEDLMLLRAALTNPLLPPALVSPGFVQELPRDEFRELLATPGLLAETLDRLTASAR
jgi:hypothetical protein